MPDLKKYMAKQLRIKLNGNRVVTGRLSGFDMFMNLVVEEAAEEVGGAKTDLGVMVRPVAAAAVCGRSTAHTRARGGPRSHDSTPARRHGRLKKSHAPIPPPPPLDSPSSLSSIRR
jgi:small nuclear ribonucleoprotein G